MRRVIGATVTAAAVVLLTAGLATGSLGPGGGSGVDKVSSPQAQAAKAAVKGTVTIAIGSDPGSLDPQLGILSVTRGVNNFAYDTLVHITGPGKVASGLAKSWKVLSTTKVRFTLVRGATCSDGSAMNASVVKRNLDFVSDPKNKSPLLGVFVPPNLTVTANNRTRTIIATSKTPNPFPLQGLGLVQMVCTRGMNNRSLLVHRAIGSGPYRLTQAVSGDHYTFQVRKGYHWGSGGGTTRALPSKIVFKIVSNETTTANLLLSHGVNIGTIIGPDRSRLNRAKLYKVILAATPNEFWFNQKNGHPAANSGVRHGLVQALRLPQIGSVITSGRGAPIRTLTSQAFTPCAGNSVRGSIPAYNPNAARSALSSHPAVRVIYPSDFGASITAAMELLQAQLSAAGARVTLVGGTETDLSTALFGTGNWDIAFAPVTLLNPSQLVGLVSGPAPPNGANFSNIDNGTYKSLSTAALGKFGASACRDWINAEASLMKNADVAPTNVLTSATYGSRARFKLDAAGIIPTSVRITK
jgi:peptide/nickel transport system substrate-binding protein